MFTRKTRTTYTPTYAETSHPEMSVSRALQGGLQRISITATRYYPAVCVGKCGCRINQVKLCIKKLQSQVQQSPEKRCLSEGPAVIRSGRMRKINSPISDEWRIDKRRPLQIHWRSKNVARFHQNATCTITATCCIQLWPLGNNQHLKKTFVSLRHA